MRMVWVSRLLVSLVLLQACSFAPTISNMDRGPAAVKHSHHDPIGFQEFPYTPPKARVYKYKGLLKAPPIRFLAEKIVETGLAIWIKRLPLDKVVEKRVLSRLHSDQFSKDMVPFLMAMQELYLAGKKIKKQNFHNYITKAIPDKNSVPGLEHTMFNYDEEKKKKEDKKSDDQASDEESASTEKDKSSTSNMIALVITVFDAIILQDPEFTLKTPPKRTGALIGQTAPHIKKLLDLFLAGMEKGSASQEAVYAIASEPARVLAATASLVDVIHLYAYKHYQMFAGRYAHKQKLRAWFKNNLENNEEEIVNYLRDSQDNKKYGVHVMVDGLQGALMESLAIGDPSSPFLGKVYNDFKNRENFRPKAIPHKTLPDVNTKWFEYVMKKGGNIGLPQYLPFFRKLYTEQASGIVRQGISTTPTISIRNIPMIQTGAQAAGEGGTGLPNFHFVNRDENRAYYFFGNDAILLDELTQAQGMKTIPERLPQLNSLNCMATYEAGADWSIDPLFNVSIGEGARDFGEVLCLSELENRVKNEEKAKEIRQKYLRLIDKDKDRKHKKERLLNNLADLENETIPEYLAFYSPWTDHFSHFKGPYSDEIIGPTGEINRLDYWLSRIEEVYKKAGIYDQTLFVMAGDHGLSPVRYLLNPEVVIFGELKKQGVDLKINKISSDEGEGPKLNDHVKPPSQKGYDVIIASTAGGNYMLDFFLDQGANWSRQPVYKELINYKLLNGKTLNVMDESLNRLGETLDYLVVRETACDHKKSSVRVMSKKTGSLVEAVITREDEHVFYESANDLLEINKMNPYAARKFRSNDHDDKRSLVQKCMIEAKKDNVATWCTEDEWRHLTSYSPRPDSVVQLSHIYDTDLAGTVNLFPAPYIGYNSQVPGKHAGELYMEKDAFVGVWGKPVKNKVRMQSEVNGSVATTIYEYLSGKRIKAYEENFGFRGLMDQIEE
ncbi:MAG: alkaline phosphatase family protein [Bacteriovoracaceae bacterium]